MSRTNLNYVYYNIQAGPVEISTERGANILFHAINSFNVNVFLELKYRIKANKKKANKKKMLTFIQFPNS